ncbi:hypothetical protein SLS62_000161 [Diatrype stigma]|uniref:Uncharacterized protein n=1 Tax=Diatrype stigma TaxID=117547 RepID=A0AAN9V0G3_9PEZI
MASRSTFGSSEQLRASGKKAGVRCIHGVINGLAAPPNTPEKRAVLGLADHAARPRTSSEQPARSLDRTAGPDLAGDKTSRGEEETTSGRPSVSQTGTPTGAGKETCEGSKVPEAASHKTPCRHRELSAGEQDLCVCGRSLRSEPPSWDDDDATTEDEGSQSDDEDWCVIDAGFGSDFDDDADDESDDDSDGESRSSGEEPDSKSRKTKGHPGHGPHPRVHPLFAAKYGDFLKSDDKLPTIPETRRIHPLFAAKYGDFIGYQSE